MKRPSFQFYPGDWLTDLALRRCSAAARGVWMDVLCVLHNSDDQYGILRWPLKEIANTIGASMAHINELIDKNVLKGSDKAITTPLIYIPRHGRKDGEPVTLIDTQAGPLWYSKRLVKDEYIRTIRGINTRFDADDGGTPKRPPKSAPKPPFGDGTSSSSSSSSSSSNQIPSEANASGGKPPDDPPPKLTDPTEIIFGYGVPMLTSAGATDKQARSFLGMLRKMHTDQAVIGKLRECMKAKPLQPLEWLAAALPPNSTSKHAGFESKNYREGVTEDGSFT